jgi:hypothetical protein
MALPARLSPTTVWAAILTAFDSYGETGMDGPNYMKIL